jgi:3-(3-hydroxy-phenyl)propionate hydroxylase
VLPETPLRLREQGSERAVFLTDLARPAFTALVFTEEGQLPAWVAHTARACAAAKVPFAATALAHGRPQLASGDCVWDPEERLFALMDAAPGTVYLLRPDGHVLARWKRARGAQVTTAIFETLGLKEPVP